MPLVFVLDAENIINIEKQEGFTLIELVIVIIILGIMAAVAIPRYVDLTADATTAAKLAVEGSVKSAFAIAVANLHNYPTITQINARLATDNTTAAATGIQFDIDGATYTVQTYTDNDCTTATTGVGDSVQCVGSVTP